MFELCCVNDPRTALTMPYQHVGRRDHPKQYSYVWYIQSCKNQLLNLCQLFNEMHY